LLKKGGWRSLGEYIKSLSPPSKTPFRFILNYLVFIWVHLIGFWAFYATLSNFLIFGAFQSPLLFLNLSWRNWGPFKLSYLLVVVLLRYLKLGCCFCWSLVFCWSFLVFWTNLVLILESFLPYDWRCRSKKISSVVLSYFSTNTCLLIGGFCLVVLTHGCSLVFVVLTKFSFVVVVHILLVRFGTAKYWPWDLKIVLKFDVFAKDGETLTPNSRIVIEVFLVIF